ncbi:MAG: High-affinity zinc uptake system binding-protein ZnuA [Chlamydiae bacterium]|nr:High-affinity zinc uptake system binding-protein ZnuA [Chlamydiota bacterium]
MIHFLRNFKIIPLFIATTVAVLFGAITLYGVSESEGLPGDTRTQNVLVSINPYKNIVNRIAGDTVKVVVLVPSGANMHTFEPTPKQVMQVSKADLWFRMGEQFEDKALPSLQSYNNKLKVVDLRDGVDLICSPSQESCPHCREGCDLHFWLNPLIMKQQAKKITQNLIKLYPEHAEKYEENLKKFTVEMDQLDDEIRTFLGPLKDRTIFVSHPAYAYFAKEYDLVQYTIEFEGRDPTPQQLTRILESARDHKVKTIFIQRQYNNKGARLVAQEIGADLVVLDPYADDYILEMRRIASKFTRK